MTCIRPENGKKQKPHPKRDAAFDNGENYQALVTSALI
jgi:hypothetical protein